MSDDRHLDVQLLLVKEVKTRIFPNWAMLDEAMTLLWSTDEVAAGALDPADLAELREAFAILSDRAARVIRAMLGRSPPVAASSVARAFYVASFMPAVQQHRLVMLRARGTS